MKLVLKRDTFTDQTSIGTLSVDGVFECYTLEDTDRKVEENKDGKIYGQTAIPRGTYQVVLHDSPKFGLVPMLTGVPNYSLVYIHPGNTAKDTLGCILVGNYKYKDSIGESRKAFEKLFKRIKAAIEAKEPVTIEVS